MVILTVVTKENPHTVYFEPQPIKKPSYIRLLSCSLYNSWFNLKEEGAITLLDDDKKPFKVTFLPGHYTLDALAIEIRNSLNKHRVPLQTDVNTIVGQLVITNPQFKKIVIDSKLGNLLNLNSFTLGFKTFIKKLNSETTYYIHCDLLDKEQNLLNGKPSTVLQTFDITGKPFEKVFYQSSPQHVLRDVSADKHISNMTISVRDQNNNLFDFNGFPLQFQIEINWTRK